MSSPVPFVAIPPPSQVSATSAVIGSVVVICATSIIRVVRQGKYEKKIVKIIIFGFLLAFILLIIAAVAPVMAAILAMLGAVGAFAVNGPTIFSILAKLGH